MKCTWKDKKICCQNDAIEKWTRLPDFDPYCGTNEVNIEDPTYFYCQEHSNLIKSAWVRICKENAEEFLSKTYEIQKI